MTGVSVRFMATSSALPGPVTTCSDKATQRRVVIRAVPLSWSLRSLDRRLCVTTFRWVCLCLNRAGGTLPRVRHTKRVTQVTVRRRIKT